MVSTVEGQCLLTDLLQDHLLNRWECKACGELVASEDQHQDVSLDPSSVLAILPELGQTDLSTWTQSRPGPLLTPTVPALSRRRVSSWAARKWF